MTEELDREIVDICGDIPAECLWLTRKSVAHDCHTVWPTIAIHHKWSCYCVG